MGDSILTIQFGRATKSSWCRAACLQANPLTVIKSQSAPTIICKHKNETIQEINVSPFSLSSVFQA